MSLKTEVMIIFSILLVLPLLDAAVQTSSFTIDSTHLGIQGVNASTSNFNFRSTTTYQQPTGSFSTSDFAGNSGWFNVSVTSSTLGSVNLSSIQCSNDTINYYDCTALTYGTNLTHIRADCTATAGTVNSVVFSLYNKQDATYYIGPTNSTYNIGNTYYYNASYLIQDSGDWTIAVNCTGTLVNSTQINMSSSSIWSLAWGWLNVTLLQPTTNFSAPIHTFFNFISQVTCMRGECGTVNVTLDPQECNDITSCINETTEICINSTIDICNETCANETDNLTCKEICSPQIITNCTTNTIENCTTETVCNEVERSIQEIIPKQVEIAKVASLTLSEDVQIEKQDVVNENTIPEFDLNTPILAVELAKETSATVYLEKIQESDIETIKKCAEWDFNNDVCLVQWTNYQTTINQNKTHVWFNVSSFSAYAGGNITKNQTAHLTIWDENDPDLPYADQSKSINDNITFFADYRVTSNGTKLTNANCNLTINNTFYNLTYNSGLGYHTVNVTLSDPSIYSYTISCAYTNYNSLSATDSISIAQSSTKSGAISTTVGATPFYTTSSNPQTCNIPRKDNQCTINWTVNTTGTIGSTHDLFVLYNMTTNTAYINDNRSASIFATITANDTESPTILSTFATPTIIYLGQSITVHEVASDNIAVSLCSINITLPNSTVQSIMDICTNLTSYTPSIIGRHNLTFIANDSSGNQAINTQDYFIVTDPLNFNFTVNQSNGTNDTTIDITYPPTGESISASNNSWINKTIPSGLFNLKFLSYNQTVQLILRYVNVSLASGKELGIFTRSTPVTNYLKTIAIRNTINFTNATLILSYQNLSVANEPSLELYKCSSWNFTDETCLTAWTDVTSNITVNQTLDQIIYQTKSFSAFSIKQGLYCGDGSCNNGESCSSCATDCGSCSTSSSGGGGGGGGGGGAPSRSSANDTSSFSVQWTNAEGDLKINVDKAMIPITQVIFRVTKTLLAFKFQIEVIDPSKYYFPKLPGAYKYMKISGNYLINHTLDDVLATTPVIKYKVPQNWIENKRTTPQNIALYRYTDGKWNMLDTKIVGTTNTYAFYESKTPGFSYFAIAYDPSKVTPIINDTILQPLNDTIPLKKITGEAIKEQPKEQQKKENNFKGIILFIIGIIVTSGIVIGVVFIGKYNRQIKTLESLIEKERQTRRQTPTGGTPLKLLNYIERQLHKNTPEKKIRKHLQKEGWSDESIDAAFQEVKN